MNEEYEKYTQRTKRKYDIIPNKIMVRDEFIDVINALNNNNNEQNTSSIQ